LQEVQPGAYSSILENAPVLFVRTFIHVTFDQWKSDFTDAILFNTITADDGSRWSRSKLDFIESPETQESSV